MKIGKLALVAVLVLSAGCASRRTHAPVVDARAPKGTATRPAPAAAAAARKPSSDYYTVQRGDTLYSIALEHGADYREMAQWNYLDDPTVIRVGQQLRVKAPEAERPLQSPQVGSARVSGRVESRPLDALPPRAEPTARTESAPVSAPPAPPAALAGAFIWPAKGKVLAEFAGPRRKGIDIDGKPGEPIVAAAAGRVTYVGSGIPGMGKLVVIRHDNGFITVYAHNRDILVKEQQSVARGQKIAELGSTDSERPKLHFQIRKGAAAVDPLLYLPKI
jgi:lipoprotein NlpD